MTSHNNIIITAGEPSGIGLDIIIKAAYLGALNNATVITDKNALNDRAKLLSIDLSSTPLSIIHHPYPSPVVPCIPNPKNSQAVVDSLTIATRYCLEKKFSALVTAPIQKSTINQAGILFSGHTEWIAAICKVEKPVMMLLNDKMRVCLATTHMPLSQVTQQITSSSLENTLRTINHALKTQYKIPNPYIGVCGLNPHAGESGHLGDEEIRIINPTIAKLNQYGLTIGEAMSADTIFIPENLTKYDAILAMYHDQGLPVIKYSGFGNIINTTLGLPIIRTSVDHGTALQLVGTNKACEKSLIAAIKHAQDIVNSK